MAQRRQRSRPLSRLLRPVARWLLEHLIIRHRAIDGLRVGYVMGDRETFERVAAALALIRAADPLLYRRLPRLLPRGIIALGLKRSDRLGDYDADCGLCTLYPGAEPQPDDAVRIALTIVHEAAHARLSAHGIGYPEGAPARIERICFAREIAFARRAGEAAPMIEAIAHQRETLCEAEFSDEALAHSSRSALDALRATLWQGGRGTG